MSDEWILVKRRPMTEKEENDIREEYEIEPDEDLFVFENEMPKNGQHVLLSIKRRSALTGKDVRSVVGDWCGFDKVSYTLKYLREWSSVVAWKPWPSPCITRAEWFLETFKREPKDANGKYFCPTYKYSPIKCDLSKCRECARKYWESSNTESTLGSWLEEANVDLLAERFKKNAVYALTDDSIPFKTRLLIGLIADNTEILEAIDAVLRRKGE